MIRVLRLLEYEFENNETAERHLRSLGVPANGSTSFGIKAGMFIVRSAIITNLNPTTEIVKVYVPSEPTDAGTDNRTTGDPD